MSTALCFSVSLSGSGFSEVTDFPLIVVHCVSLKGCGIGFNSRRLNQTTRIKPLISVFFVFRERISFEAPTSWSAAQLNKATSIKSVSKASIAE